jgi:hypothetical protein
MNTLAALVLVTPIYGFSLTPPALPSPLLAGPVPLPEVVRQVDGAGGTTGAAEGEGPGPVEAGAAAESRAPGDPEVTAAPGIAVPAETTPAAAPSAAESGDDQSFARLAAEGARRRQLRTAHRALGIVTWIAMTATITIGALQFADSYGASSIGDTRCAQGNSLLGSTNCDVPYAHIIPMALTTAAYFTTFGLSFAMRDRSARPSTIESDHSRRLRMHRALRWVHLAGMASQIVGGLIFANLDAMGVRPDQNYDTLRGLNIYHLVVGGLTWVALTWAGALFITG